MVENPIIREVRAIRAVFAEEHGCDIDAMFAAWKDRERTDHRKRVSPPPKRVVPARAK